MATTVNIGFFESPYRLVDEASLFFLYFFERFNSSLICLLKHFHIMSIDLNLFTDFSSDTF